MNDTREVLSPENHALLRRELVSAEIGPGAEMLSFFPGTINRLLNAARAEGGREALTEAMRCEDPRQVAEHVPSLSEAERHELGCLRARVQQIEYPCSPHCDGYLRELALRNAARAEGRPSPPDEGGDKAGGEMVAALQQTAERLSAEAQASSLTTEGKVLRGKMQDAARAIFGQLDALQ